MAANGVAMAGPSVEGAVTLAKNIALDPTYFGYATDFISGWTPLSTVPATWAGLAGLIADPVYDWWKKW